MNQAIHGGNIREAAQQFGRDPQELIDFSSNLNIWIDPILPDAAETWREITRYPEVDAMTFRQQLASIYAVPSADLLPTAGAAEALYLAMRLLNGKRVGIVEPAYGDYSRACRAAGVTYSPIQLAPEEWFSSIITYVDRLKEFEVIVLGNPNNPTGNLHSRTDLIEVLCRFPDKIFMVDEAFIEFVENHSEETLSPVLAAFPSLIIIGSLTKSWRVPGLRLGFIATSNSRWIEQAALFQPPWSINALAQLWAKHNLSPDGYERMQRSLAGLPGLRKKFVAQLQQLSQLIVHAGSANFLMLELRTVQAMELYHYLGQQGFLVRLCDSFAGVPSNRFIRVAVRHEQENADLVSHIRNFFGVQSTCL